MARTTRRMLLVAAVALLVGGCLAPTLPLPPPSQPSVAGPDASGNVELTGNGQPAVAGPDANGNVELTGSVQPSAEVYVRNYASVRIYGQITGSEGTYDITLPAKVGDQLELWYTSGNDESPSIVFQIRAP